ncbi:MULTISPECIES: 5-formyltetrahydrofolate cyclo-ligase [unclassified Meridianimarinicoccus]|uniref:5-formyltetrahydrofolate cyclo-ligase n=1 Tax=unclassified Meridianimarinicoccus TaxID=2923344 RepID=UPI001867A00D|nr:5-formyltetrahydrofolate cyclo-ligase [Fluviibacterium sp. MJW13]
MSVEAKTAARKAGFARRKTAHDQADPAPALAALRAVLSDHQGAILSGYMAIHTEMDPLPVMSDWTRVAPVAVPVILGKGQPLSFHRWTPEAEMTDGPFGARIPARSDPLVPEVLIVPMVAFSRSGARLGYGGGFYDRTLEGLRARGRVLAIGLAYAAQEDPDLPVEPVDQTLDMIVTEQGVIRP